MCAVQDVLAALHERERPAKGRRKAEMKNLHAKRVYRNLVEFKMQIQRRARLQRKHLVAQRHSHTQKEIAR
jgi:hypothetical protein